MSDTEYDRACWMCEGGQTHIRVHAETGKVFIEHSDPACRGWLNPMEAMGCARGFCRVEPGDTAQGEGMKPSELRQAARKHGMRLVVEENGGVAFCRDLARCEFQDEDAARLTDKDLANIARHLDTLSATLRANAPT